MTTTRMSLEKLVAGVSTHANLISYFNSNADIIDAYLAKSNWNAGALDPDADNDDSEGYAAGSMWYTTTAIWECVDATTGAAVWRQVYPAAIADIGTNVDFGSYEVRAQTFQSDVATGTAPIIVASATKVTNLNADLLDGNEATAFAVSSHDHAGGDGAQIDHGGLGGLSDDDHTQYIKHALATAESDFLVASGSGAFVKKTLAETQTILGVGTGGAAFWDDFPDTITRVSDTSFSIPDASNANLYDKMFDPGTIVRWEKSGGGNQFAVITAAAYSSNAVTYTIMGNTLSAGFSTMKFCIHKAMQDINILPGTCPLAAETGIGKTFLLPYDIYVFGARLRYGTAPTTTGGTWDVNDDGTSIFTTKPTIAASATMGSWQVADCLLADALTAVAADSLITTDYDSGHATTPGADAYVRLLFMPVSWRYRA